MVKISPNINPNKHELTQFLEAAFSELTTNDQNKFSPEQNQSLSEWLSVPALMEYLKHGKLLEARDDARLVGVAFIAKQNPLSWPDGHKAELFVLAVDPISRGNGTGSTLLKSAEVAAKEFGAKSVVVNTNSLMDNTIRFYLKNEYTEIGKLKGYYDNGDAIFLSKQL